MGLTAATVPFPLSNRGASELAMPTNHRVSVASDERIAAVHHEAASTEWIVFCHGLISDKTGSYEGRCRRAAAEGFNAVRFDFRGCGESDGTFVDQTLSSRIEDLAAVVEYFDPASYTVFGSSFGGKVAFHTATTDDRVDAVVTRAPVTYNRTFDELRTEVAAAGEFQYDTGHRVDDRFFDDLDQYEFTAVEAALDRPVTIVHGGTDESVAPEHSYRAAERLDTDVLLLKFADEGHRFSRAAEAGLRDAMFDWLARVLTTTGE